MDGCEPEFDESLAAKLTSLAGVDLEEATTWCYVHIVRLLRYQESEVAVKFGRVLSRVGL
jgi:hypothetical protein